MSLEKVMSISGKPGLYKLVTQTRGGFLAESLLDGKKINISARSNVSLLSEIAVYTLTEEVPLREVLKKMQEKENGGEAISHKASKDELEEYFFAVVPDYDEDKVYPSDIKKIVQWYNLLHKNGIVDFSKEEAKPEEKEEAEMVKTELVKKAPAKAKVTKTAVPKASTTKKGGPGKNTSARKT